MRAQTIYQYLVITACVGLLAARLQAADAPREHLSLDANWKFHLGDDWGGVIRLDQVGRSGGPPSDGFWTDASWRTVNLPHDWAVDLPFDKAGDGNHGFKPLGPGF